MRRVRRILSQVLDSLFLKIIKITPKAKTKGMIQVLQALRKKTKSASGTVWALLSDVMPKC